VFYVLPDFVVVQGIELFQDALNLGVISDVTGNLYEIGGAERVIYLQRQPLVVRCWKLVGNSTRKLNEVRSMSIKPFADLAMVHAETARNVEVAAAVLQHPKGPEVDPALSKPSFVFGRVHVERSQVVGFKAAFDVAYRANAIIVAVDFGKLGVSVAFGEAVFDEVVKARRAGLLDPGGDTLSSGADCASEASEIAAMQTVLVVEEGDEGEVLLGVGEELWEVGVAGDAGVFVLD